jgi:hypothetical protein
LALFCHRHAMSDVSNWVNNGHNAFASESSLMTHRGPRAEKR